MLLRCELFKVAEKDKIGELETKILQNPLSPKEMRHLPCRASLCRRSLRQYSEFEPRWLSYKCIYVLADEAELRKYV